MKILKWLILTFFSLLFLSILTLSALLFFRPEILINSRNMTWILNKTEIFESWSWKEFEFDHDWKSWDKRILKGHIKDFCLVWNYQNGNIKTCLEEVSWKVQVELQDGLITKTLDPFKLRSSFLEVTMKDGGPPDQGAPPDLYGIWSKLWSGIVPDLDVEFSQITFKDKTFDFKLLKSAKTLQGHALDFQLDATPEGFILAAPSPYLFPKKLPTDEKLFFRGVELKGKVREEGITLSLTGMLEALEFSANSLVKLPLKNELTSIAFRREVLLETSAKGVLYSVKGNVARFAPDPYKTLPAPINEMDGKISIALTTEAEAEKKVRITSVISINMESKRQALVMDIGLSAPVSVKDFSYSEVMLNFDFKRIALLLPRISKKKSLPQFLPDRRIKRNYQAQKKDKESKGTSFEIILQALNEKSLNIKTDLLDQILRLNFNFKISGGHIQEGYLTVLPLKTKIFKRPIHIKDLTLTFHYPLDTVIKSTVKIPLPEYEITMKIEGQLSNPRYAFTSQPPLPESDIYAVLLFGRPMSDLNSTDRGAARRTNQLLSQSILSLSVLYFLAGSPVEYVGYDAESNRATAQFGLGRKTSISVSGNQGGLNASGVRRSLGKGWYLDTTVQSPGASSASSSTATNYGVLLERIIAY